MIAIFFRFNFFYCRKSSFYHCTWQVWWLYVFLGFPVRCVLSISLSLISKSKCSFIALIHSSSVFSCFFSGIPCSSKQLHLECYIKGLMIYIYRKYYCHLRNLNLVSVLENTVNSLKLLIVIADIIFVSIGTHWQLR